MMGEQMQHERMEMVEHDCEHEWEMHDQQIDALVNRGLVSFASAANIPSFPLLTVHQGIGRITRPDLAHSLEPTEFQRQS